MKRIKGRIKAVNKNGRADVSVNGNLTELICLSAAICKSMADMLAKEKGITMDEAEGIIIGYIRDGMDTL